MNLLNIQPSRERSNTIINAGMNIKTRLFNDEIHKNRKIFDESVSNIISNIEKSENITFIENFDNSNNKKIYISGGAAYYLYGESFSLLNENNERTLIKNCPRTHDYDVYIIAKRTLTDKDKDEFLKILDEHAKLLSNKLKRVNGHIFNNNNIRVTNISNKKLVKINRKYSNPANQQNTIIDYQYNMTINHEGVLYTDHIFEFIIYQSMPMNSIYKNLDYIKILHINNNIFKVIPIRYLISLSLNSLLNRYSIYITSHNPIYLGKVKQDACRINYLFKCLKLDDSSYLKILYKIFNNILHFIITLSENIVYIDKYNNNNSNKNYLELLNFFDKSVTIDSFIQSLCHYQFYSIEPSLQHYINSFIITI